MTNLTSTNFFRRSNAHCPAIATAFFTIFYAVPTPFAQSLPQAQTFYIEPPSVNTGSHEYVREGPPPPDAKMRAALCRPMAPKPTNVGAEPRRGIGRVIDELTGVPLAGVVVTGRYEPWYGYTNKEGYALSAWTPDCVLHSMEAVTDSKGRFELDEYDLTATPLIDRKFIATLGLYRPGYYGEKKSVSFKPLMALGFSDASSGGGRLATSEMVGFSVGMRKIDTPVRILANPHKTRASTAWSFDSWAFHPRPICLWEHHVELLRVLHLENRELIKEIYAKDEIDPSGYPLKSYDNDGTEQPPSVTQLSRLERLLRMEKDSPSNWPCAKRPSIEFSDASLNITKHRSFETVNSREFWKPPSPEGRAISMSSVTGSVIDAETSQPVLGALVVGSFSTVSWEVGDRPYRGAFAQPVDVPTDAHGRYNIPSWTTGTRRLTGTTGFPEWSAWPQLFVWAPGYTYERLSLNLLPEAGFDRLVAGASFKVNQVVELETVKLTKVKDEWQHYASATAALGAQARFLHPCDVPSQDAKLRSFCVSMTFNQCIWERYPNFLRAQLSFFRSQPPPVQPKFKLEPPWALLLLDQHRQMGKLWQCADPTSVIGK